MTIYSAWQQVPASTSVAVIGGGIAGVSVAYWLSSLGVDCTLLERDRIASAASGRNDGQVLLESAEFYNRMVSSMGRDRAMAIMGFRRDCIQQLNDFSTPLTDTLDMRRGCAAFAGSEAEEKEFAIEFEHLQKDGFQVQWLDKSGAAEKSACDAFDSGIYFPDDLTLDPLALTECIASSARLQGATILPGVEVNSVRKNTLSYIWKAPGADSDETGEITFDMVVIATNAYTPALLDGWTKRLWPVRAQMLVMDPVDKPLSIPHGCQANNGYDYWKERDGKLYIGGRRFLDEQNEYTNEEGLNDKIQNAISAYAEKIYERKFNVLRRWSGVMCFSQDGLPLIGALPGFGNRFMSAGFTGYGLSYAFHAGHCLAKVICDGDIDAAKRLTPFQPRRFIT